MGVRSKIETRNRQASGWARGALLALVLLAWAESVGVKTRPSSPVRFAQGGQATVPLGFSPETFEAERRWEERYLAIPDAARCGQYLRRLTAQPHVAGTPGDRRVTEFIYEEFKRDGLNPEITEYRVLLSYPKKISVELVAPKRIELANPEPVIPGDKDTRVRDPMMKMPWNGYSPSADFTAPVVYVNYGNAEDYDQVEKFGVAVRGKIVLARYFHGYRGGKSLEAEKRGVAGVIVYSDPAEDGAPKGQTYPQGPWGPLGHIQRGAVVYDFLVPGDPLTPGWASTNSARRLAQSESKILPKIPMVPLSAADARQILTRLEGPVAPKDWQGGLPFPYHLGDGNTKVHLAVDMEYRVTAIWNVIAKIPGSQEPEKLVILSNHHDAWGYGAVDPSSGTASMLEAGRAFGQLVKEGFRPRRSILFGSWDAEEYTMTGSTEWGEQFEEELKKNAVVSLNVDPTGLGQDFTVSTVPALLPAILEATQAVRDPATGRSVYERWKEQRSAGNVSMYGVAAATTGLARFGLLGGGSDYMVFLQHDGVPALDMGFEGPFGVYHSLYDDYAWVERFGDPGFHYQAAMSRLWGLLALRFADADVLPLDYSIYASEMAVYLEGLEKIAPGDFFTTAIRPLIKKCGDWHDEAARITGALNARRKGDLAGAQLYKSGSGPRSRQSGTAAIAEINAGLMAEERALLDEGGIPGRPWFRHLVYAPLPSYEAETLPGLREALLAKDPERAREQAERLGRAIDRAAAALRQGISGGK